MVNKADKLKYIIKKIIVITLAISCIVLLKGTGHVYSDDLYEQKKSNRRKVWRYSFC
jgi:hypothetical protein